MEVADGTEGVVEMMAAASVVSQDAPVLQARDRMLDARSTSTMDAPAPVTQDASTMESWRAELGDTSVTAVGEDVAVHLAERLEGRAAVVNRVITIPGAPGDRGDDGEVPTTNEELSVARPAVVLGLRCAAVIPRGG